MVMLSYVESMKSTIRLGGSMRRVPVGDESWKGLTANPL